MRRPPFWRDEDISDEDVSVDLSLPMRQMWKYKHCQEWKNPIQ
jgi:hypothetical protein